MVLDMVFSDYNFLDLRLFFKKLLLEPTFGMLLHNVPIKNVTQVISSKMCKP